MDNEEERWAVIWATLWAHTHYSVGTGVLAYTAQRRVRPSDVYSCACTRRALCLSSRASKALRARGPEATWQLSRRRGLDTSGRHPCPGTGLPRSGSAVPPHWGPDSKLEGPCLPAATLQPARYAAPGRVARPGGVSGLCVPSMRVFPATQSECAGGRPLGLCNGLAGHRRNEGVHHQFQGVQQRPDSPGPPVAHQVSAGPEHAGVALTRSTWTTTQASFQHLASGYQRSADGLLLGSRPGSALSVHRAVGASRALPRLPSDASAFHAAGHGV